MTSLKKNYAHKSAGNRVLAEGVGVTTGSVPVVFGLPGSVSQRFVSGSGSSHHQAKAIRKPLISTVL
jgi:hypothetical protein